MPIITIEERDAAPTRDKAMRLDEDFGAVVDAVGSRQMLESKSIEVL